MSILDLNVAFYAKIYPYIQFLRSRFVRLGQNERKPFFNLVEKIVHGVNELLGFGSPPYGDKKTYRGSRY